jgi:mycothiol synthase
MPVTIAVLDPVTAAPHELRGAYELMVAGYQEAAAEEPVLTYPEWVLMNQLVPAHLRRWHWTTPGGYANLVWMVDARSADTEVFVAAEQRRQGIGTALLDAAREQARGLGCRTLFGSSTTTGGALFAAARGASAGNSQYRSILTMPPAPVALDPVSGYRLRSWTEHAPEELVASYALARNAIHDAPQSDGAEEEQWTPQMVRDFEAVTAQRGRQIRVTVALDSEGSVAAFTELRLSPEPGAIAWTEETATVGAHRGKGIATWVKAESLRVLAEQRPDATVVATGNDTTNGAMLAVNRRLGFRIVNTWADAVLSLS